jgi:hypothetical protein
MDEAGWGLTVEGYLNRVSEANGEGIAQLLDHMRNGTWQRR